MTLSWAAATKVRASTARLARISWKMPMMALITTTIIKVMFIGEEPANASTTAKTMKTRLK
jgi:UDP-N-acetyl-D-mannosaminuronic acid transferase (WecB/TagA/CpsF family)